MRVIGGRHYVSRQLRRAGRVLERVGPLELEFVVAVDGGGIRYDQTSAALRLGGLCVPIPRAAAPWVRARAEARGERRFFVRVDVHGPRAFPLFSYWGLVEEA
jgi:hypothetical protein